MKKIFTLVIVLLIIVKSKAQTIEEAKKHIYYERLESAKNVLESVITKGNASPDAWYWLAEIYLEQKKTDAAKKILREGETYFSSNNFSTKKFPLLAIGRAHALLDSDSTADARGPNGGFTERNQV